MSGLFDVTGKITNGSGRRAGMKPAVVSRVCPRHREASRCLDDDDEDDDAFLDTQKNMLDQVHFPDLYKIVLPQQGQQVKWCPEVITC